MRIAVVGAGISGLASAYFLSRRHDVKLFERNDYFGGHSNTVSACERDRELDLDTGFVVYNEGAYPRFSRLLRELDVPTQPSDMSFSVTCRGCELEYSSRGVKGLFATGAKIVRPRNGRFLFDLWRFFRQESNRADDDSLEGVTLRSYLTAAGFSGDFERHFLVPLASAVWSMPPGGIESFPAGFFLRFLRNHGLIGGGDRWRWRTIAGGSRAYVNAIIEHLGRDAFSSTPVNAVKRCGNGVSLVLGGGEQCHFDATVLACHADQAADLLTNATDDEREALACFTYTKNRVVLHTDSSLLPARPHSRASWNYVTDDCHVAAPLTVTYHLNRLQSIESVADYCVTVNPPAFLRSETVLRDLEYDHPAYTFRTLEGQRRLGALNGKDGIYYAGAHLGYGFHEDGVGSAARVATMLGVDDA